MRTTSCATVAALFMTLATAANADCGKLCDKRGFWLTLWRLGDETAQIAAVEAEIAAGADINGKSEGNLTPIQLAVLFSYDPDLIRLMIDNGADPHVVVGTESPYLWLHGQNLIHLAIIQQKTQLEMIQVLEAAGVPLGDRGAFGRTDAHFIAEGYVEQARELYRFLVSKGVDINAIGPKLNTPMHVAAANIYNGGHQVAALLDLGADPCIRNEDGKLAADLISEESRWHSSDIGREGFSKLLEVTANCEGP